jgi:ankyrin repeat protein
MKKIVLTISALVLVSCMCFAQVEELFSSCLKCDLNGVKKIIESGLDVNSLHPATKQNALAYSYMCPDITKYLLDNKCDPNGGSYPALIGASSAGSLEVIKLLLENGADPNKSALNMYPLIQLVKMTNCAEAVDLLLRKGADKNVTESIYGNVIGIFAANGLPQNERKEAIKKYNDVLKGYGLNVPDSYYHPDPIINATPDEMIKVLVKHGIDINQRGKNVMNAKLAGETPLFTAMNVGKTEIILALLNNGADYNETHLPFEKGFTMWDVEGEYTPLMYACVKGYPEVIKWLSSKKDLKNVSVSGLTLNDSKKNVLRFEGLSAIYLAIMAGDIEVVKMIAGTSSKWNDFEIRLMPGQKFDSKYGSKESVYNFIVTKKSVLKYTPALFADFVNQKEIAEYLKSKGF